MTQSTLDKPGAGLPFIESLYVRWYVGPYLSRKSDKDMNLRLFKMIGGRILKEYDAIAPEKRDTKVLVPKMKGVEDSSRFWCPNEVLEHLLITGYGMRGLIVDLANGRTSDYIRAQVKAHRAKIGRALRYLEELGHLVRRPAVDYLGNGLYELRVAADGHQHRMLHFFHGKTLIVVTSAFLKNEDVVPSAQLARARR